MTIAARRSAAVGGNRGDVPLDLDAIAEAAHERGEALRRVRGWSAIAPDDRRCCGEGYSRQRGDKAAGGDGGLPLASDLEGQLALEDIERIGVAVVNVRAGDPFARRVAGAGDCHLVARDEMLISRFFW